MCDCRNAIEQKLTHRFKETSPDASGHKVKLQGYAYFFGEKLTTRAFMPYKLTADFPLKKGGTKIKNETGNMFFNYCPFCGEKQ